MANLLLSPFWKWGYGICSTFSWSSNQSRWQEIILSKTGRLGDRSSRLFMWKLFGISHRECGSITGISHDDSKLDSVSVNYWSNTENVNHSNNNSRTPVWNEVLVCCLESDGTFTDTFPISFFHMYVRIELILVTNFEVSEF